MSHDVACLYHPEIPDLPWIPRPLRRLEGIREETVFVMFNHMLFDT
jgi:hypothetical protein